MFAEHGPGLQRYVYFSKVALHISLSAQGDLLCGDNGGHVTLIVMIM